MMVVPTAHGVRRTRMLAWGGLAILTLVLVSAFTLPFEGRAPDVVVMVVSLLPIPMASVQAFRVLPRVSREERRFWWGMGIATALLAMSESYWWFQVVFIDPLGPRLPHPFELLQLGAALSFMTMVMYLTPFGAEPLVVRVRYCADVLIGVLAVYIVSYHALIVPLFREIEGASPGLPFVGAAYPALGVVLVAGTFGVLLGLRARRWRVWEGLFATSMVVYTSGILVWPWWYLGAQTSDVNVTSSVSVGFAFAAGFYLLFMAGVYRLTDLAENMQMRPAPAVVGRLPRWASALYLGTATLSVPVLAAAAVLAPGGRDRALHLGAAISLAVLLAARTWLTAFEGSYLFARSVTDDVTGLPNRRAFDAALARHVSAASGVVSVIAIDVDGFSRIAEIAGRESAEDLLRKVVSALSPALSAEGGLFTLGEDDLIAVVPGADLARGAEVAAGGLAAVRDTVRWGSMAVSVSAGVASAPAHGDDGEDVVRKAMVAREWARASGGGRMRVYEEDGADVLDPAERLERIRRGEHLSTVRALASAVDVRDPFAPGHSRQVAAVAVALAREIGMNEERVALVETAALLHDIGKLAVEDALLGRPHLLTRAEREAIESHPALGERILASAGVDEILPWVRHHHERWSGDGYPDRLAGEAIPIEARVIAIADAYDVMTSGRPYRPALGHHQALRHIELDAGGHFDPSLVGAFVRLMWDAPDRTESAQPIQGSGTALS